MAITIRPYTECDRSAVRHIACKTSDRDKEGRPLIRDRRFLADLLTRYYTDFEPQSLWVAEDAESVVGYISGCLKPTRYARLVSLRIIPAALFRILFSRSVWYRETWRLFWALLQTWFLEGFPRTLSLQEYPAHLHINILSAFRSQHIGTNLMTHFLQQVRSTHLHGVHASVREDNVPAIQFFKNVGFLEVGTRTFILPEETGYRVRKSLVLGMRVPTYHPHSKGAA